MIRAFHLLRIRSLLFMAALLAGILFISGCQTNRLPTTTPDQPEPETAVPTPSPTPEPLGSTGNPISIGFVILGDDSDAVAATRELALRITVQTGYAVQSNVYRSYEDLLADMRDGRVHLAWLPPLTYVYANNLEFAEVSLLTNHFGTYYYGTQFLANAELGYTSYFDPTTNQNTADAQTALEQFVNTTPCWVEPSSIGGYILPAGILDELGIEVQPGVVSQTSTSVVRALYVKGICEFGATFSLSGDPRTAEAVLADLPDARERIMIVWRSDPLIPNLNLSFLPNLPDTVKTSLTLSFLDLVKTEEGKTLLTQATQYDIQDLREVDDSVYDPIRGSVERTDTNLRNMIGK